MNNKFGLIITSAGWLAGGAIALRATSVAQVASSGASPLKVPVGYQRLLDTPGIKVFKSQRADYVSIIDLHHAEAIDLTGKYTDAPNGKIAPRSMSQFWQDSIRKNTPQRRALVVINGAFFAKYNQPTGIAFGLKSAGKIISYGYGLNEFPGLNKTIAWNNRTNQARIDDYDRATFNDSRFPEVVGALDPTAGKRANRELGRTFIGIKDSNGDGKHETVLVFSSKAAKQIDAVKALQSFGATAVVMLDGGGSTGLVIAGDRAIDSGTSVPHAIGFYTH